MWRPTSAGESRGMSNYDNAYVRAEQAYRAAWIRAELVGSADRAQQKSRPGRRRRLGLWNR